MPLVKQATQGNILTQATRLFAARGFDGTSLQDIADAVGIRKQSLLYHYGSKDELRRAVLEALLGRWNDVLPRLLMAASSGEDQFYALVEECASFFTDDPDRARLLMREMLDRPDAVRAIIQAQVAPWLEVVSGHIRRGQDKGNIFADADPEAYVVLVINLVMSCAASADCLGGAVPRSRQMKEVLRLTKAGLFRER